MTENALQSNLKDTITNKDYRLVTLWAAVLILLYIIAGYFAVRQLQSYKAQTARFRQDWIKISMTGQASQDSGLISSDQTKPADVNVGIYINHIGEFSPKDNKWTADFDVWFSWTGDQIHPGENFEIVDGQIELKEKIKSSSQGNRQYECYHVQARILKYIDASRFPFNDEELAIQIEDRIDTAKNLRYVADSQKSDVNPQAIRRFLKITKSGAFVKLHNWGTARDIHSRFIYAMLVSPLGIGFYIKMFQGLFASVAIAFIALFLKPTHFGSRFSLGIGAFFAVIGNNISIGSNLFISDKLALTDMASGLGLVTIFFILAQSAVSLYIFDSKRQEKLSRLFDKVSFVVLLLGYVIINMLLPLAAKS